jgi:hypothetical protein
MRTFYQAGWKMRWAMAAIAAAVTTTIGLSQSTSAQSSASPDYECGLSDALKFQTNIENPREEADPAYMLRTAEAFIALCPDRLERREAHVIAARGALDSGDGLKAAHHYDSAIARGARLNIKTLMDYAVALQTIGANDRARAIQNAAVMKWTGRITETGVGQVEAVEGTDGTIYKVIFEVVDPNAQISAMWVALPNGGGLPATVLVRSAAKIAAWRAMREGAKDQPLMVAEMNKCRERVILAEAYGAMRSVDIESTAMEALKTYLRQPDGVALTAEEQPIASCMQLSIMLHTPDPQTAVPSRF